MSTEILPSFPRSYKVSELMHGDNPGFIINAYLALQRQWPDKGGYQHYLHILSIRPQQRPEVLREIAASPAAKRQGTELVDDQESAPPVEPDPDQQYIKQCVSLRIPYLAQAFAAQAAKNPVDALNGEITRLQQRIEEQDREIAGMRRELRNFTARLAAAGVAHLPLTALPDEVPNSALAAEVEQLKATVGPLHHFATVELKRLFADYVNALMTAHLDAVG